jgi:hypothetical protein
MQRIKTILEQIDRPHCFDAKVNCYLIDGWKLKKRGIVAADGAVFLYAELEWTDPPQQ